MGRQIAVKLSEEKEREFIKFLKRNNCVLIYPWSKNRKLNIVSELPPRGPNNWFFDIWNRNFKLNPTFIKIKEEHIKDNFRYKFHIIGKPILNLWRNQEDTVGRIYWEKYFATNTPDYNVEEFEKWYNAVVKWFKKNCKYENGVYVG